MSTLSAEKVVSAAMQAARAEFGNGIEAIYVLGSLAHGGFAPLVSDIDVAIILAATSQDTAERVARVSRSVAEDVADPLAERLSLFWGDWGAVRTGRGDHLRLGPVDRLDLLDSGRLLAGADRREPSDRPSAQELIVMSADHILSRFSDAYLERLRDVDALLDGGPRAVTKAVLFPVRFMFTVRTGRIGLNDGSAHWYAEEGLTGSSLALKALEWRSHGIADRELAAQMLAAELTPIHAECFAEYATELDALGEGERASAMAARADSVRVPAPDAR